MTEQVLRDSRHARRLWGQLRQIEIRDYGVAVAFVALFLALTFASSHFLTTGKPENAYP